MRPILLVLAGVSLAVAACGPRAQAPREEAVEDASYATPPVVTDVARSNTGGLIVRGQAGPDERIRLIDASGRTHGVSADAQGRFNVSLPAAPGQDRLLSLTVQRAGRAVSSDGWLFSPAAAPGRAVMLRPGAASLPVGGAPLLAVADYDGGGGLALAGVAQAGATVSVTLDGQPLNGVTARADGRWFVTLPGPVASGGHQIVATSGAERVARSLSLSGASPATAIETEDQDDAIRVNWRLPGGGAQTTWILGR